MHLVRPASKCWEPPKGTCADSVAVPLMQGRLGHVPRILRVLFSTWSCLKAFTTLHVFPFSSFSGHPGLLAPSPGVTENAQCLFAGGWSFVLLFLPDPPTQGDRGWALQLYTKVHCSCEVTLAVFCSYRGGNLALEWPQNHVPSLKHWVPLAFTLSVCFLLVFCHKSS